MSKRLLGFISTRFSAIFLAFLFSTLSLALHAATITGVVKDKLGHPIPGANASLFQALGGGRLNPVATTIKVGADGAYAWTVSPGSYVVRSSMPPTLR